MAKKTKSYNVLLVGVLGLLAVGTWVIFDIYRGLTSTTLTEVQQQILLPLKVDIDEEFLNRLRQRRQFNDGTLNAVVSREIPLQDNGALLIQTTITPTPIPTFITEDATSSASSEVTPEATTSASQ